MVSVSILSISDAPEFQNEGPEFLSKGPVLGKNIQMLKFHVTNVVTDHITRLMFIF